MALSNEKGYVGQGHRGHKEEKSVNPGGMVSVSLIVMHRSGLVTSVSLW